MTIQAINAQALRPATSFKRTEAPVEAKTFAPENKDDSKKTGLKLAGGAVALAALGFGVYKFIKNRNAKQAERFFEALNPPKGKYGNQKAVHDANRMVKEFEAMQRRLTDHAPKNVELNAMNWDAKPLKRSEVIEGLRKEAAEAAKKDADAFALKMRTAK